MEGGDWKARSFGVKGFRDGSLGRRAGFREGCKGREEDWEEEECGVRDLGIG